MQKIKFSHEYFKMPVVVTTKKTYLLGVSRVNYKDLPQGFITYDTIYTVDGSFTEYYPLPKTELIILTLFTDSEQSPKVWTTVRRYTPKKYEYYCKLITKQIEIVLTLTTPSKDG